jgi:hypothetical protein
MQQSSTLKNSNRLLVVNDWQRLEAGALTMFF